MPRMLFMGVCRVSSEFERRYRILRHSAVRNTLDNSSFRLKSRHKNGFVYKRNITFLIFCYSHCIHYNVQLTRNGGVGVFGHSDSFRIRYRTTKKVLAVTDRPVVSSLTVPVVDDVYSRIGMKIGTINVVTKYVKRFGGGAFVFKTSSLVETIFAWECDGRDAVKTKFVEIDFFLNTDDILMRLRGVEFSRTKRPIRFSR